MATKIIDNRAVLFGDDLKQELLSGSKVKLAASCFTLFAYDELKIELANIDNMQIIFTEPTYTKNDYIQDATKKEKREFFIPKNKRENNLYGTEFEIRLKNKLSMRAIAKQCADWVKEKAIFKSNTTSQNMQSFLAVQHSSGETVAYITIPQEFSASGLGYQPSNNIFTSIVKIKNEDVAKQYLDEFDKLYNDNKKLEDVTKNVLDSINTVYKENSPEFMYFVALYNIFTQFLEDLNEDNMPNEATGFKKTKLWNTLYDFQKDGVIAIINKIEKHNGCILADSVGLGKTFTALAVMSYYILRNKSVLVLCPKRLGENWLQYTANSNDITNIFYEDRLNYEVLYHTDLARKGRSHSGRDLRKINWGNYDLVVIDESHNFRNSNTFKDRESRYDFLQKHIIKSGVNTKVLLLSATPVNNRYIDLKNQLSLCYAQDPTKFEDSLDTQTSINTIFRQAQQVFNNWSALPQEKRNTKDLIDSLSIDFKILLDSVTIARSRKSIIKYYDMQKVGKFPERKSPISYSPELTDIHGASSYKDIYTKIKSLNLAVYGVFDYIFDSAKEMYLQKLGMIGTQSLQIREKGVKSLVTINLLKRLESSVQAFRLTIKSMIEHNNCEIDLIKKYQSGQLPKNINGVIRTKHSKSIIVDDYDDLLDKDLQNNEKDIAILYEDIDCISWKNSMLDDVDKLQDLLSEFEQIKPQYDKKLQKLKNVIDDKIKNPINQNNKKVLIFSAFADTANYLYDNIEAWAKNMFGTNSAVIEGTNNRVNIKHCTKNTNDLLTMFSPISKNRDAITAGSCVGYDSNDKSISNDIDILIATDCISEGQNLQDCDFVINYDIHWNPVRIVQRFGRIDRLGSKNKYVQLVNFWPPIELNEYLNLIDRVKSRMAIVDQTSTADDNILSPDEQASDYRDAQIRQLQNGQNIDLEGGSNGVSINDLGLNEFRMDVAEYIKNAGMPSKAPYGMHAVLEKDDTKGVQSGVIYVLKNHNADLQITTKNLLHPYYLVYTNEKGEIINSYLETKQILDVLRLCCKGKTEPIMHVCKKFNTETDDGLDMKKYNKLLSYAVNSIVQTKTSETVANILSGDVNAFLDKDVKGLDDFELVAFFVIK